MFVKRTTELERGFTYCKGISASGEMENVAVNPNSPEQYSSIEEYTLD